MRLSCLLSVFVVLAGCGRLGFDAIGAGAGQDAGVDLEPDAFVPPEPVSLGAGAPLHLQGSDYGHVHGVAIASDGDLIVAGHFAGDIDVGLGVTASDGGTSDAVATRVSPAGVARWEYYLSGPGTNEIIAMDTDSSGNVYLAGYFDDLMVDGQSTDLTATGIDAFLISVDAQGAVRWAKKFGGVGYDAAVGVRVVGSRVVVVGSFETAIDLESESFTAGSDDGLFVAAFDLGGTAQWAAHASNTGTQGRSDIAALDGDIVVVGQTGGDTTVGGVALGAADGFDLLVLRIAADGSEVVGRRYAAAGDQGGDAVAPALGGGLWVAGNADGVLDFDPDQPLSSDGQDGYLARLGPDLAIEWAVPVVTGPGTDYVHSMAVLADGTVLVGGEFRGNSELAGTPASSVGLQDLYAVQIDTAGNRVSAVWGGSDREEAVMAVAADPTGGAYAAGHFGFTLSVGTSDVTAGGFADLYVLRLDPDSP